MKFRVLFYLILILIFIRAKTKLLIFVYDDDSVRKALCVLKITHFICFIFEGDRSYVREKLRLDFPGM